MPTYKFLNEHMQRITSSTSDNVAEAAAMAESWNKDHRTYPTQVFVVVNMINNGDARWLDVQMSGAPYDPQFGRPTKK